MCDVRPFCGLRYRLEHTTDLSSVITPPYDVISVEDRALYYRKSPYNIIRMEFGEEQPDDSSANNKYTRAAATLDTWLREGILAQEERPAFYLVEHRFPYQDNMKSRWGLIARVGLEDPGEGRIKPHEQTTTEPAIDRLRLLKSCRANFSPIMGIVRTKSGELVSLLQSLINRDPDVGAADSYGVSYRLWVVTDVEAIAGVSQFFSDRVIYIADGHHRYMTALHYQKEQRAACSPGDQYQPFDFVMMSLMDSQDPGLVMLPTHRLVRAMMSQTALEQRLSRHLVVEDMLSPLSSYSETTQSWLHTLQERGRRGTIFGAYGLHGQDFCIFRLREDSGAGEFTRTERQGIGKYLDVDILHQVVLHAALGIDSPEKERNRLVFTRDELEAVDMVNSGEYQLAFFLNPAPISSVLAAADAGRRLPQKTTYFHPKTPAGLVINPIW